MSTRSKEKLFTTEFVLVSLIWMMIFASYYVLVAALPVYVISKLGGQESDIGLVMGIATISTVLLLPFFGRLSDKHGRKPVLLLGIAGLVIAGLLYAVTNTVPLLLALRFVYGAIWAAAIAALLAALADVSPITRRGEAMGYSNIAANVSLAIAPVIALTVIKAYDFTILFGVLTAFTVVALILGFALPETVKVQQSTVADSSRVRSGTPLRTLLFSPAIMMTTTIAYGTLLSFLAVYALSRGVDNPGPFFTVLAIFLMSGRALTGRLSDILGRRAVILPGMGMLAAALFLLSASATMPSLLIVAALYGAGFGAAHSSLMALGADYADDASRGRAMSYLAASVELGIGLGSIFLGQIVPVVGFSGMYVTAAVIVLIGAIAFVLFEREFKPVPSGQAEMQLSE